MAVTTSTAVTLGGRRIGGSLPTFVIAEAGVNHNGDLGTAVALVREAADAGVDAVKFQSFVTDEIVTPSAPKAAYQIENLGGGPTQREMLKALELAPEQQRELARECSKAGVLFLSTPYDPVSLALLDSIGVAGIKVASTDTTNIPFLKEVARLGRAVILSTGMCDLDEVDRAVSTLRSHGNPPLIIMQCTSEYPSPTSDLNLRVISAFAARYGCPVGFSDHSQGFEAALWAIAAGACCIEKHFTLDRRMAGPDHAASLEPAELRQLVAEIRRLEDALGDGVKRVMPSEAGNKSKMQKSLTACRDIAKGEVITRQDVACRRPMTGLGPERLDDVVGRRAARDVRSGDCLTLMDIEWS